MTFLHPEVWLLALLAAPLVLFHVRRRRARRVSVATGFLWRQALAAGTQRSRWPRWRRGAWAVVDLVILLLIVAALAGPMLNGPPRPVYAVFLIDASASIAPASRQAAEDFVRRAVEANQGRQSAGVRFAAVPIVAREPDRDLNRNATDLAAALETGCRIAPPNAAPHVVLLSDGVATRGDTEHAIEAARGAGIPVSVVPLASREPEIYLVENQAAAAGHLAKALRAGGMAIKIGKPQEVPGSLDRLSRFDAVALVNVPAASLTGRQVEILKRYVRQGGGLVTIGGDQAFAAGGYRHSALEEVLPVESEPPRKAPRPGLAMVLVVDRSLSMEEGGAIDLAREAMRRAVQLLRPEDQLGVLAFDEQTRWVSPIERLGDKAKVLARIGSITAGGRTDMAPALDKAYLALREAFAAQKHIIVLTDGISHPADFEAQAGRMARDGITLSTVALGKEASRPLLEDMARIGKGRFYACDSPQAVPSVFALETASASRLGIYEGPFFARKSPPATRRSEGRQGIGRDLRSKVLAGSGDPRRARKTPPAARPTPGPFPPDGFDLSGAPSLLGYAQTRPKPGAQVVLTAIGGDPLLAWLRVQEGLSVAFTSDVESRWAAAWLGWRGFNRFWIHAVRGATRAEQRGQDYGLLRRIAAATGGVYRPEPESVWDLPAPGSLPPAPIGRYLAAAAAILLVGAIIGRHSASRRGHRLPPVRVSSPPRLRRRGGA